MKPLTGQAVGRPGTIGGRPKHFEELDGHGVPQQDRELDPAVIPLDGHPGNEAHEGGRHATTTEFVTDEDVFEVQAATGNEGRIGREKHREARRTTVYERHHDFNNPIRTSQFVANRLWGRLTGQALIGRKIPDHGTNHLGICRGGEADLKTRGIFLHGR